MTAPFLAGVVAGYGVAIPVGAIAVLIAGLSARTSLRVGAAAGLGAATADGIYALAAVLGGAALAGLIAPVAVPLRWVAAAVLLGLAAHTAWSALRPRRSDGPARSAETTPLRAYLGILSLTLLNPATVVYFAALVLGRGGTGGGVMFVLGAFVASASWQLLIAGGGSLAGRVLTGERARLVTALVSSAVIAVLAIQLL
ncbi:LysE family transporter [Krasilnikovia sp. M28-CT-15]|uniref:LysE family transporter n=1 Tax=Krasilnikovia sp. M28-CT-15 TaxID=3373540 RepID=UPI0038764903